MNTPRVRRDPAPNLDVERLADRIAERAGERMGSQLEGIQKQVDLIATDVRQGYFDRQRMQAAIDELQIHVGEARAAAAINETARAAAATDAVTRGAEAASDAVSRALDNGDVVINVKRLWNPKTLWKLAGIVTGSVAFAKVAWAGWDMLGGHLLTAIRHIVGPIIGE
ncbi:MAG: hypothetical protein ACYDD1_02310 [Caulobacteraceae bacterium]